MSEDTTAKVPASSFRELGVSGLDFTSGMVVTDPEVKLRGVSGVEQYDLMRREDPTVSAVLLALTLPIRQAKWRVNPASDTAVDVEAAEFVESCLYDMDVAFDDVLTEACTMYAFGWSLMEWVLKRRVGKAPRGSLPASEYDDGRIGFKTISLRSQMTLWEWEFDNTGKAVAMIQDPPPGYPEYGQRRVPFEKCLHFRTTREQDNPEGLSVLRPSWRPWKFKRSIERVEAIGLHRSMLGFPVVSWEQGFSSTVDAGASSHESKSRAIIKQVYDNKMLGVIEEPGMTFRFETPDMQGVTSDSSRVIQRHDESIARSALAMYILLGSRERGSYALAKELSDLFFLAIEGFIGVLSQVFNSKAIPLLMRYNSFPGITGYPELTSSISRRLDLETLSEFVNKMVSNQVLTPDPALEEHIRSVADFPPRAVDVGGEPPVTPQPGEEGEDEGGREEGTSTPDYHFLGDIEAFQQMAGNRLDAFQAATAAYKALLRQKMADWIETVKADMASWTPATTDREADTRWQELVAGGVLLFKQMGWEYFYDAAALGYGSRSIPPPLRLEVENELFDNDRWVQDNLFAGAARGLGQQTREQALRLYYAGETEEADELIEGALWRRVPVAGQYSGHFWRTIWVAAIYIHRNEDRVNERVRWNKDPLAEHCADCLLFGNQDYEGIDALMAATGGILPGTGTECDGNCRCWLTYEDGPGLWEIM